MIDENAESCRTTDHRTKKTRKPRKRNREPRRFAITVDACAISIGPSGPGFNTAEPEGESHTCISIEGTLDRPLLRDVRAVHATVFEDEGYGTGPGAAIGVTTHWQIVLYLPRDTFNDLRALVLAERLAVIRLWVEELYRGRAKIRSVSFDTAPLPCEQDQDGGQAPNGN